MNALSKELLFGIKVSCSFKLKVLLLHQKSEEEN